MNKYATFGRQATALVRELAGAASPSAPLVDAVDAGGVLWALSEQADDALTPIKDRLRGEARQQGQGTHLFNGNGGTRCQVTVPTPQSSVTDVATLRDALDPAAFDALFETVVAYKVRPDFAQRLLALPQDQQQAILRRMKMSDPTPRVSFKIP